MKSLHFIAFGSLEPVDNGYKSTATQLIRSLVRRVQVTLFRLPKAGENTPPGEDGFDVWCDQHGVRVVRVDLDRRLWGQEFLKMPVAAWLAMLFGQRGDWIRQMRNAGLGVDGAPIMCFGMGWDPFAVGALQYFSDSTYFPADSITLFERNRLIHPSWTGKLKQRVAVALAACMERRVLKSRLRRTFFVSRRDAACAARIGRDRSRVRVVPIGIDPDEYPQSASLPRPPVLIFSGVMDYLPNSDAARVLVEEIFPLLKSPGVHVRLVGKGADNLTHLAQPGVELMGWVPSIAGALQHATLFVAPLRMGAGAKNKIVQAFAAGLPVVGTRTCFSGFTRLPPGAYVCESTGDFATTIDRLLSEPAAMREIAEAARRYAILHCTWGATADQLLFEIRASISSSPSQLSWQR